jgi:hypothetical protein
MRCYNQMHEPGQETTARRFYSTEGDTVFGMVELHAWLNGVDNGSDEPGRYSVRYGRIA